MHRTGSAAASLIILTCACIPDASLSLRVIGAGLGRTGTQSLKKALNTLGYGPTYHMDELLFGGSRGIGALELLGLSDGHNERWADLSRNVSSGLPPDLEFLESDYGSAVDAPASCFWSDLLKANPDAKVVLTVRDPDAWRDSARDCYCRLYPGSGRGAIDEIVTFVTALRPYGRRHRRLQHALNEGTRRTLGSGWEDFTIQRACNDRDYGVEFFNAWNEKVIRTVPRDRLLVFETGKHGWRELSDFLGVDPPDEEYPRSNDRAEFGFIIVIMRVTAALTVGVPAWVVWRLLSRKKGRASHQKND